MDKTYDVFLSHNSADKTAVELIAQRLRLEAELRPFLDEWHLIPGTPRQEVLEAALLDIEVVAVFIGPSGVNSWHNEEMRVALDKTVRQRSNCRVIPVLLPEATEEKVSTFLARRVWVDFRHGLDDEEAFKRLVAGIRGEVIDGGVYELPDEPAPYRGLLPFETDSAQFYFGRRDDCCNLIEKLGQHSFVALLGASGSGKSSLIRAGLLPALQRDALPGSSRWTILSCMPGSHPLQSLAAAVATVLPFAERLSAVDELSQRLTTSACGLSTAITTFGAGSHQPILLIIDQFEEIFTQRPETLPPGEWHAQVESFVANLATAVRDSAGRMHILVSLRSDFLEHCLGLSILSGLLQDREVLLGALSEAALREAIVQPAVQVGAFFEKGLVDILLRDVNALRDANAVPGELPLLQEALYQLWKARRGPWLTLEAYHASGGVAGALDLRADTIYTALASDQQNIARSIFLRLVRLGEQPGQDTRRIANRQELYPETTPDARIDTVIQILSGPQARLIMADDHIEKLSHNALVHKQTVQLSHEVLIRKWNRLVQWLAENRHDLVVHRQLSEAAAIWEDKKRERSYLYGGARLAEAEKWAQGHTSELNAQERTFLTNSQRYIWLGRIPVLATAVIAVAIVSVIVTMAATGTINRILYPPLDMDWIRIDAGVFYMGSTEAELEVAQKCKPLISPCYDLSNELSRHPVDLTEYEINHYEVTNREYRQCVNAGVCSPPDNQFYDEIAYDKFPVTDVDWGQAQAYCRYEGGDLPTEAQWEKAARGPSENPPQFPWQENGDQPDSRNAFVDQPDTVQKPMPVGSFPLGDSFYKIADMAGNVWEWTLDWYAPDYYHHSLLSPVKNPRGPETGDTHTLRGGSFDNDWVQARSTYRNSATRSGDVSFDVGFRCIR